MLTEALHYLGIESFEIPTVRIVCHRRHLYSLHVTRGVLAEVQRSISLSPRQKERVQGVGGNVRRLVPSPTRIVLKKPPSQFCFYYYKKEIYPISKLDNKI